MIVRVNDRGPYVFQYPISRVILTDNLRILSQIYLSDEFQYPSKQVTLPGSRCGSVLEEPVNRVSIPQ